MSKHDDRPSRVRWMVLVLASATSWFLYLHRYSWGVIKSDVNQELNLSNEKLGWLDSAFSLAYCTLQIPGGLAGDLFGPALVLPLIILAWSVVVGATVLGKGFWSLFTLRVLFGAAQAGTYPNLGKVTRSWFPFSNRTTMQGVIASFSGRAGGACAPILIGTVLMGWLHLSWRQALLAIAVFGIAFAVIFRLLFRDRPADHPWTNAAEVELIAGDEPPGETTADVRFSRNPLVLMSFFFLLLHIFTSAFADQLFVNWIPKFLLEEKELSREAMGIFASLPLFGGAIGGMFGGALNDWLIKTTGRKQTARSAVGLIGKLVAAVAVVVSLSLEDGRAMMLVVAVGKFFTDWSQPTVWGAITDISGPAAGRVFGTVNMAGSFGGIIAGPLLGKVIDVGGWDALFWTIVGLYVVSGVCWMAIDTSKSLILNDQDTTPGK